MLGGDGEGHGDGDGDGDDGVGDESQYLLNVYHVLPLKGLCKYGQLVSQTQ